MIDQEPPASLDVRLYLWPLWRRKWVILLVVLIAAGAAYALASTRPRTYEASTHIYIENADPTSVLTPGTPSGPPTPQQLQDIATLFTAQAVTSQVYHELRMAPGSAGSVNVVPEPNSSFVTVTAVSRAPELAARLANAYARVFLRDQRTRVVQQAHQARVAAQAELATLHQSASDPNASAERQTLLTDIAQLESIELDPSPGAQQIDTALVPTTAISPRPLRDGLIGAGIGLVLGVLLAYALEVFDNRIVSLDAIERVLTRPVLALLPHVEDPAPFGPCGSMMAVGFVEPVRMLRVQLELTAMGEAARVLVVTSAQQGEGKSVTARAVALTFAEAGKRVLVIDADLRRPAMERLLQGRCEVGLVHVLTADIPLENAVARIGTPVDDDALHVAASNVGSRRGWVDLLGYGIEVADPVALLSSARMQQLLLEARQRYDVVVVDTPPVLAVGDAVPLLRVADSTLVVVRLGQTTRGALEKVAELLDRLPDVSLTGTVVNDLRRQRASGYSGYGYGYGDGGRVARLRRGAAQRGRPLLPLGSSRDPK